MKLSQNGYRKHSKNQAFRFPKPFPRRSGRIKIEPELPSSSFLDAPDARGRRELRFVKIPISYDAWRYQNYQHFERSPPFFFSRVARRIFFEVPLSREAQRNCFCLSARSAEKIFYLFARSAEKLFFSTSFARNAEKICLLIRAKRGEKFLLIRAKRRDIFLGNHKNSTTNFLM